jgi:hypothetical protein
MNLCFDPYFGIKLKDDFVQSNIWNMIIQYIPVYCYSNNKLYILRTNYRNCKFEDTEERLFTLVPLKLFNTFSTHKLETWFTNTPDYQAELLQIEKVKELQKYTIYHGKHLYCSDAEKLLFLFVDGRFNKTLESVEKYTWY